MSAEWIKTGTTRTMISLGLMSVSATVKLNDSEAEFTSPTMGEVVLLNSKEFEPYKHGRARSLSLLKAN